MTFALAKRPETYRNIMKRSFRLYRRSFFHVFILSLLLSIIAFIPRILIHLVGQNIFADISLFNIQRLWLLVINIADLIVFTAMLWRVHCVITGAHDNIGDDIKISVIKIPYILVAVFLQTAAIGVVVLFGSLIASSMIGAHLNSAIQIGTGEQIAVILIFFLQFLVVIYLFYGFYFYLPIILIENKGILPSLIKSLSLIWGNWWRTYFVQITPWAIYLFFLILVKWITRINIHIYFFWGEQEPTLLITSMQIFIFSLFMPLVASTLLVQLNDLELRKKKI